MRKVKKSTVVKAMSMGLAVAIAAGSIMAYNVKSNANESQASNGNGVEVANDEIGNFIDEIKSKYPSEERITDISDLYAEMDKKTDMTDEEREELFASASETVIRAFFFEEMKKGVEATLEMANADDDIEGTKVFINDGNSRIVKEITNNYGTTTTMEITDTDENSMATRGWTLVDSKSETLTKGYGDRKYTAVSKVVYFHKKIKAEFRLVLGYTIGKNGITVRYLKDDGSSSNYPLESISIKEKYWTDKQATHVGANIDAVAIYESSLIGGSFGGFDIPSAAHYNRKIVASVKIISWDKAKKTMKVQQSFKAYNGPMGFLS